MSQSASNKFCGRKMNIICFSTFLLINLLRWTNCATLTNIKEHFFSNKSVVISSGFILSINQSLLVQSSKTQFNVLNDPDIFIIMRNATRNKISFEPDCYPLFIGYAYPYVLDNGDRGIRKPYMKCSFRGYEVIKSMVIIPINKKFDFLVKYFQNKICSRTTFVAEIIGILAYKPLNDSYCPKRNQSKLILPVNEINQTLCIDKYQNYDIQAKLKSFGAHFISNYTDRPDVKDNDTDPVIKKIIIGVLVCCVLIAILLGIYLLYTCYLKKNDKLNCCREKRNLTVNDTRVMVPLILEEEKENKTENNEQGIKPLLNIFSVLRNFLIEKEIALPSVVVVGDQSSGKTSILESLSGVDLPKGMGLVTKCPLIMEMRNETVKKISISYSLPNEPRPIKKEIKFTEITETIIKAQNEIAGSGKTVKNNPITLNISSPESTNLSVIDLPGLIRTSVEDQPNDMPKQIKKIALEYIKPENNLILCVINANLDLAVNESLSLAKKVDPDGIRTLGVITKCDLVTDDDNKLRMKKVLEGEILPKSLKRGFVMVHCRCQSEIDQKLSLKEFYIKEEEFFSKDSVFKNVDKGRVTIKSLSNILTENYMEFIQAFKIQSSRDKEGNMALVLKLMDEGSNVSEKDQTNNSPLHYACQSGYYTLVELLINREAEIDSENDMDETPLHQACKIGSFDIVQLLLVKNANVNKVDKFRNSPLHYACQSGNSKLVELLIEGGAEIDSENDMDETPLHEACKIGSSDIVQLLLDKRANVNKVDKIKKSPLHHACEHKTSNNSVECVKLLLANQANVNLLTNLNKSPLHLACENGNMTCARLILDQGVDVNIEDNALQTPLYYACRSGNLDCVKFLIENKADVRHLSCVEESPLHAACENDNPEILQLLIMKGSESASFKIDVFNKRKETPLHIACRGGYLACVKLLLENGANKNQPDNKKQAPLHIACKKGYLECVKFLLENGADKNQPDSKQKTPLHYACLSGHSACVKHLLDIDVDIEANSDKNETPLYSACKENQTECAELLIKKGANINCFNQRKFTPLHLAVKKGNLNLIRILIENKADIHREDDCRMTAKNYARDSGQEEIFKLFQSAFKTT